MGYENKFDHAKGINYDSSSMEYQLIAYLALAACATVVGSCIVAFSRKPKTTGVKQCGRCKALLPHYVERCHYCGCNNINTIER